MASHSDDSSSSAERARPSAELIALLRKAKDALRRERERLPLREKVRLVIELQRMQFPLLAKQRELKPWERPWEFEP